MVLAANSSRIFATPLSSFENVPHQVGTAILLTPKAPKPNPPTPILL